MLINIFAAGSLYFLCGFIVALSYSTSRAFCFSHAVAISSAPYFSLVAVNRFGASPWIAALVGLVTGAVPAFAYQRIVGRWMRNREVTGWQQMLASLGYFIVVQNLLALVFGDQAQLWLNRLLLDTASTLGGHISLARLLVLIAAFLAAISAWLILATSQVGIRMRATASSPELATIMGVNIEQVRTEVSLWTSTVAALVGLLAAADVDMTPSAGLPLFLLGMVVAIIGGMRSLGSLALAAFFLACSEQMLALFIENRWIDSIAYVALITVLILKPLGFSGRRLKQVEV